MKYKIKCLDFHCIKIVKKSPDCHKKFEKKKMLNKSKKIIMSDKWLYLEEKYFCEKKEACSWVSLNPSVRYNTVFIAFCLPFLFVAIGALGWPCSIIATLFIMVAMDIRRIPSAIVKLCRHSQSSKIEILFKNVIFHTKWNFEITKYFTNIGIAILQNIWKYWYKNCDKNDGIHF